MCSVPSLIQVVVLETFLLRDVLSSVAWRQILACLSPTDSSQRHSHSDLPVHKVYSLNPPPPASQSLSVSLNLPCSLPPLSPLPSFTSKPFSSCSVKCTPIAPRNIPRHRPGECGRAQRQQLYRHLPVSDPQLILSLAEFHYSHCCWNSFREHGRPHVLALQMLGLSIVTDVHLYPNDRSKSPVHSFHLSPFFVSHRENVWVCAVYQRPHAG